MSLYKNLEDDLPKRNKGLLNLFYKESLDAKLDVSFLLMIATSGFIIPYETLIKKNENYFNIKLNRGKYKNIISNTKTSFGYIKDSNIDSFEECTEKFEKSFKSSYSEFFSIIRNALAHGNILVTDEQNTSIIHNIIFISENNHEDKSLSHKFLEFKVEEFYKFLILWFEFLENLELES